MDNKHTAKLARITDWKQDAHGRMTGLMYQIDGNTNNTHVLFGDIDFIDWLPRLKRLNSKVSDGQLYVEVGTLDGDGGRKYLRMLYTSDEYDDLCFRISKGNLPEPESYKKKHESPFTTSLSKLYYEDIS